MGGSVVGVVSINILSIAMTVIVITKTINNLTIITLGPGSIPWFFVTELFAQSGIKWHQYHRDETKTNAIFRSMDLSPTMHSSFIITFDLTKVTINNHQLLTHLLARPTDSHLDRGGGELDSQFPRRARLPTDEAADGALGLHGLHRHPALLHRLRRRRRAGDQGQDD